MIDLLKLNKKFEPIAEFLLIETHWHRTYVDIAPARRRLSQGRHYHYETTVKCLLTVAEKTVRAGKDVVLGKNLYSVGQAYIPIKINDSPKELIDEFDLLGDRGNVRIRMPLSWPIDNATLDHIELFFRHFTAIYFDELSNEIGSFMKTLNEWKLNKDG